MATAPAQKLPSVPKNEELEQRFRRLEAEWERETSVLSDPAKIMGHPAIQAIIAMGQEVVPLILRDLQAPANESLIVRALPEITGENPLFEGNNDDMVEAWLQWGRRKGLV